MQFVWQGTENFRQYNKFENSFKTKTLLHLKQKHSFVLQHLTEEEKEAGEPKKRKGLSHPESRLDLETATTSSALPQSGENLIASQESDDHSSTSTMTVSEYQAEPSTSTEITSSLFKQATIVSAFKTISSFKDGGSVKLTEALVKFVVQDNLPFNIVEESHTADYIALELAKLLEIWGVDPNDVVAVVTDSAANMVKAIHDKFGKNRHIPCFAHTLNLVCESSLTNAEGLNIIIDKVRSIVVWFKRSVKASDQLRKVQIDAGTSKGNMKKMILDVRTRWNSTYYMLEKFLQMIPMPKSSIYEKAEVEHLRETCKYLKPLEKMTVEISGENYPTIGYVIPMIGCLVDQYNDYLLRYEIGKQLKTTLLKEIEKRFGAIEKSYIPAVSTILDPRFKQIHFRDPQAMGTVFKQIHFR
ncbi:hypothetical protein QE152_g23197 [Popillia japonica]|uniref:Transposase n=1 Tax=Popillia japonica TaxID=7064 RepID=A0AAW1KIN5_POPJA